MAGRDATRNFLELCEAFAKQGMPRPLGPPVALGPPAVALGPKAPAPALRPLVVSTPKAAPPTPTPSSSSRGEESSEESRGARSAAPGLAALDAGDDGAGGRERDEGPTPSDDDFPGATEDAYQLPALSEEEAADTGGEDPAESRGAASSTPGFGHEEGPPIDEGMDGDEDGSENAFRKRLRLQHLQARDSGVVKAERSHNQFRGGASGQVWRFWVAAPRPILLCPVGSPL